MKSLTLRIYLAVVAVLMLFAMGAAWLAQRNLDHDREYHRRGVVQERYHALSDLIENSLPSGQAADAQAQAQVLLEWSARLRVPLALDDAQGRRLVTSPQFEHWERRYGLALRTWPGSSGHMPADGGEDEADESPKRLHKGLYRQAWQDGRVLWMLRQPREGLIPGLSPPAPPGPWLPALPWLPANLLLVLLLLFVAVALGAWPVVRRLTRRLKNLQSGVERFGSGHLQHRVAVEGHDEVADLARSFNAAADRVASLVQAHRSLLANASHELRSPLARLKMAVTLMHEAPPQRAEQLQAEIHQDIAELDALVEEVLLASRLDAQVPLSQRDFDVSHVLEEEAQHVQAEVIMPAAQPGWRIFADERLVRRAIRNLLENAQRYGRAADSHERVQARLVHRGEWVDVMIEDRGPGVPAELSQRIFEPFYRLPGHAEHAGGVGLGLSLVRQIAERHSGRVYCEAREGGGSRFVLTLPVHLPAAEK